MTHEQERTIAQIVQRIRLMRHGRHGDNTIRASLISEGWPIAAVNAAFEKVDE